MRLSGLMTSASLSWIWHTAGISLTSCTRISWTANVTHSLDLVAKSFPQNMLLHNCCLVIEPGFPSYDEGCWQAPNLFDFICCYCS